jgi:hypothetical protein
VVIISYKNRRPRTGDQVQVYRKINGDEQETWSIRATRGKYAGLVVGHADEVLLRDVVFRVQEAGRQRVLSTGQKNVHSFADGRLGEDGDRIRWLDGYTQVTYDPYRSGSFLDHTGEPIDQAKKVFFGQSGRVWAS